MLTFLLIGGAVLAITALAVTSVRPFGAADTVLAGEPVGLSDPAADTLAGGTITPPPARTDWHLATLSALCDAEELLDCLEARGYAERELVVLGNSSFTVRWR